MAEPIGHVEGGECRCLRCEAFGKRPDEAANVLETRRRRLIQKAADRERLAAGEGLGRENLPHRAARTREA